MPAFKFHSVSVVIALGKRPVTFRTRKLSLSAPMVLQGGPCGRVGRRRTIFPGKPRTYGAGLFCVPGPIGSATRETRGNRVTRTTESRRRAATRAGRDYEHPWIPCMVYL